MILPAFDGHAAKRAIYAAEVNNDEENIGQKGYQEAAFSILQRLDVAAIVDGWG